MAEVERSWFTMVLGGERGPFHYSSRDNPDGDFDVTDADPEEAFATWQAECADARRQATAAPPLDVTGTTRHGGRSVPRWIMIERGTTATRTCCGNGSTARLGSEP
jgi:hypothetical protein